MILMVTIFLSVWCSIYEINLHWWNNLYWQAIGAAFRAMNPESISKCWDTRSCCILDGCRNIKWDIYSFWSSSFTVTVLLPISLVLWRRKVPERIVMNPDTSDTICVASCEAQSWIWSTIVKICSHLMLLQVKIRKIQLDATSP